MKEMFILPARSVLKQGRQSLISVTGLSVAIASCILILLYIRYEFSYDRYHENADMIYRVLTQLASENHYMGKSKEVVTPSTLKDAIMNDIPGVERACRCRFIPSTLEYNSSLFTEKGFLYADKDFLDMFTFPAISGNPSEALRQPFSLFVTRSMAEKYFGSQDPIGKTIKANNKYVYTVRGVLEDIPPNSHFRFDFLTGFETLYRIMGGREKVEMWFNFSYLTYIQLSEGSDPEQISNKLESLTTKYIPDEPVFKGSKWILQPLKKIHLGGQNNFDPSGQSDIRYVFLVATAGLIIILFACINYMNMATARSFSRGREIGVLKVSGGSRTKIIFQLIAESVMLSLIGLVIALEIVSFILPVFAGFTDRPLTYSMIFRNSMPYLILAMTVLTGAAAGLFPALMLSSFNPLRLIREEFTDASGKRKSRFLRNVLLVIQYTISIVALVSVLVMTGQLRYMKTKDQGFISRNVVTIEIKDPDLRKNPVFLVNEIKNNHNVSGVTASGSLPYRITSAGFGYWEGKPDDTEAQVFKTGIDTEFLDFYNLELVSGRGFSTDFRDDSLNNYIVNETAARLLGKDDPVGKKFGFQKNAMGTIVGVIKDFNFQSLVLPVEPLAISAIPTRDFPDVQYISVKVNDGDIPDIKIFLAKLLKQISPGYLNPVSVLSESIDSMYASDRRVVQIIMFATVLALILACLGQYSLSFYSAQKQVKEMAIRKVFGAAPVSIMSLFSREMTKLILVAVMFGWPVSFFIMNKWLQHYAFRINPKPSFFIISLLITVSVSMAATAYHVIRLSRVNPAETIRYE